MITVVNDTDRLPPQRYTDVSRLVEHVRTIHFSLMVSCVVLGAALSLTFQPRGFQRAQDYCNAIIRICDDTEWQRVWAEYALDQASDARRQAGTFTHVASVRYIVWDVKNYQATWVVKTPAIEWMITHHKDGVVRFAEWNGKTVRVWAPPPRNLAEFATFWDDALQGYRVTIPVPAEEVYAEGIGNILGDVGMGGSYLKLIDPEVVPPRFATKFGFPMGDDWEKHATISSDSDTGTYYNVTQQILPTDFPTATPLKVNLVLDVKLINYRVVSPTTWLADHYERTWKAASFDVAFPELAANSKGPLRTLPLNEVAERLKASAITSAKDVEIMTIKLPAEVLTRFGPVIIVAILFYLMVHLRLLLVRIPLAEEGFDLPWIGMFPGRLPRFAFMATTVALPICVLMFSCMRARLLAMSAWDLGAQVLFLVVAVGIVTQISRDVIAIWQALGA
jgi:hypothetical protein